MLPLPFVKQKETLSSFQMSAHLQVFVAKHVFWSQQCTQPSGTKETEPLELSLE